MNAPWFFRLAAIGALAMSLSLTACGRKGPLDAPPARASAQPAEPAPQEPSASPASQQSQWPQPNNQQWAPAFGPDASEDVPAPKGQKKGFFLDWLLN